MEVFKKKLLYYAISSRIIVFILQAFFNLIPDHNADAFKPTFNRTSGFANNIIATTLDGFHKWDSKYFLYIAENGYPLEKFFAFFPLYPLLVRVYGDIISAMTNHIVAFNEACLLAGWLLNNIFFVGASFKLYDLTQAVFNDESFSIITSLVFCYNPASVFFSSLYTESLFSFLVFSGMSTLMKQEFFAATTWFVLSGFCRSNGLINAGFIAYYAIALQYKNFDSKKFTMIKSFFSLVSALVQCCLICLPFLLFNLFGYLLFCIFPKKSERRSWCKHNFFLYDYVQKENWNLGFLNYYELKKLPNFILSLPTILIISECITYYTSKKSFSKEIRSIGIFSTWDKFSKEDIKEDLKIKHCNIFCFVTHALFLTSFAMLFMHIEVTTRMLFSSTPIPCWLVASFLYKDVCKNKLKLVVSMQNLKKLSKKSKQYLAFFGFYFVVGCLLHVNFLPWT